MRPRGWTAAALAAFVLAGCSGGGDDGRELEIGGAPEPTVEEMGILGARVDAQPEQAEDIVAEGGLTPAEFETRIREITDDPEEAARYARAFEAAAAPDTTADGGG